MVSVQSDLKWETIFEGSNPPSMTMTDIDIFQQFKTRITEMERHHEEELIKLKAYHNQLEVCVRHP